MSNPWVAQSGHAVCSVRRWGERLQTPDGEEPDETPEGAGQNERVDTMEYPARHSIFRMLATRLGSVAICDPRNGL
jgi:hypothetical protein